MAQKKTDSEPKKPARRKRSDSTDTAVAVAAAAFREVNPPAHVRMQERDMPFFDSVIAEFARAEWSEHQLEIAALLAQTMSDLEEQQFRLREEGLTLEVQSKKKKKYFAVNPRNGVVQTLAARVLSYRRSLSLHARAREGEARDAAKRRQQMKGIEQAVQARDDDDDLINRPAVN